MEKVEIKDRGYSEGFSAWAYIEITSNYEIRLGFENIPENLVNEFVRGLRELQIMLLEANCATLAVGAIPNNIIKFPEKK